MEFKEILYTKKDGIATITLNRPHVLNAFSSTMLNEWVAALEEAKYDDEVRVVVVTGTGRGFCSGADVKAMASGKPIVGAGRYAARLSVQRLPRAVESLDKPYIAAINGPAVGGGFDTASMADIRIAADTATFSINHLRIAGLSADGGYYFLTRILGMARTLELVLTHRFFDAQEALRIGYVSRVVPAAELAQATWELASMIAKGPPVATQLAKRLIHRCLDLGLDEHLEDVEAAIQINNHTDDAQEGPRAWAEKRTPIYKGK
ncbi:MAG TPA: enoyl-CoA hydratase-related protein [Dehalococcoidia bacterium]|nr:enoyl-CoA hydratase-related protein [Dehalococcoidia bacterium]